MLSLILGIIGLFVPGIGIAAIIVGRRSPEDPQARVGVVLGYIGTALTVLGCCAFLVFFALFVFASLQAQSPQSPQEIPTPTISTPVVSPLPARGYLGIRCENRGGARVAEVFPHSPAERAGIRVGDVVTHIQGKYVPYCADLASEVEQLAGQTVDLTVLRNGQRLSITVTVEKR